MDDNHYGTHTGGQWVELPTEADEPFKSGRYDVRRFALMAVRCYIGAIESDEDVLTTMSRLQNDFNERYELLSVRINFESEFLKYLRLCGGDRCLRESDGAFDMWVRNFKSAEVVAYGSDSGFIDPLDGKSDEDESRDEDDDESRDEDDDESRNEDGLKSMIGDFTHKVRANHMLSEAVTNDSGEWVETEDIIIKTQEQFNILFETAELLQWEQEKFERLIRGAFIVGEGAIADQWLIIFEKLWAGWIKGVQDDTVHEFRFSDDEDDPLFQQR
jgi:hypothetical protein